MSNTGIVVCVSLFGWVIFRRISRALKPRRFNLLGAGLGLTLILTGLVRVIVPNAHPLGLGHAAIGLVLGGLLAATGFRAIEFLEVTGKYSGIYRVSKALHLGVFLAFMAALCWRILTVLNAAQASGTGDVNPEILSEILNGHPLLSITIPCFFLTFYLFSLGRVSYVFLWVHHAPAEVLDLDEKITGLVEVDDESVRQ